jgi:hypothetical protein
MPESQIPENLPQPVEAPITTKASIVTRLGLPNLASILRLGNGKTKTPDNLDPEPTLESSDQIPTIPKKEPISQLDPNRLKALASTVLLTGATMFAAPSIIKSGVHMLDSVPNANTEIVTEANTLEQLLTPDNTNTLNNIYRLRYIGSESSSKFQMNKDNVEMGISGGDINKYSEMSSFLIGIIDQPHVTDKLKPSELKLLTKYALLFEKEHPRTAN